MTQCAHDRVASATPTYCDGDNLTLMRCCVLALQQHAYLAWHLCCIPTVSARLSNRYALSQNPLGNGRDVTCHTLKHLWV
jgi:hypothetical protein